MCIFCDIIDGKIPSKKVYEDDSVLAILDISQTTYGHTLVMPKKHYKNFLDCPEDELKNIIVITQKIAKKIESNLNCNGFNILSNVNEVSGQTVDHLHFHIIPRYNENDSIKIQSCSNDYNLDEVLSKIKAD